MEIDTGNDVQRSTQIAMHNLASQCAASLSIALIHSSPPPTCEEVECFRGIRPADQLVAMVVLVIGDSVCLISKPTRF